VLETALYGQAADALVVKWLMENQKAVGGLATFSNLVDRIVDNPAARIDGQEITVPAMPPPARLAYP